MWKCGALELEKWCLLQPDVQVSARSLFHLWCGEVKWRNGLWVTSWGVGKTHLKLTLTFSFHVLCVLRAFPKQFLYCGCRWIYTEHFPGVGGLQTHPAASRGQPEPLDASGTAYPDLWVCTEAARVLVGTKAPWTRKYWNLGWVWEALVSSWIV